MPTIKDIMTQTVLTAKKDTPFNEVVSAFTKSNIRHLPILNSNGSLRAIISATDVLSAMHEMDQFAINCKGHSIEKQLSVRDEMSSDVLSITKDTSIEEAINMMIENNIHALPVMENDEVEGIFTSHDVLKAIYEHKIQLHIRDDS